MKYFVLGGARSGKSHHAQRLAQSLGTNLVYMATAEAGDEEMSQRIARHIADRDETWKTVEAPIDLRAAIDSTCRGDVVVLVDCLTLWLSNILLAEMDVPQEIDRLVQAIASVDSNLVLVSNEVGLGLVPGNALGRQFRDEQGRLNRQIASVCDKVEFIAAGLPILLKG